MGSKRTRNERKDQRAEQRRQQQARDRRQRRIVYSVGALAAILIIALVPLNNWYQAHQRGKQHSVGFVRSASSAAKAAGCTGVRNDRQIPTSIVKPGSTVDYARLTAAAGQAVPPTSGPREANPLPDTPAFYSRAAQPRPERAVGNLDHGYIVIWYDSQLPDPDIKTLQAAVGQNTRTLVVPWTRSVFPDGRHVVLTAWDRTQRCTKASNAVITDFANSYRDLAASQQGWASPSAPTPNGAGGSTPTPKPTGKPTTKPTPSTTQPGQASATPSAAPAGPSPKITVSPAR